MVRKEYYNAPINFELANHYKLLIYLFNNQNDFSTNFVLRIAKKLNMTVMTMYKIRKQLTAFGLVRIELYKRQREIYLTPKGLDFAMKLNEVDKIIKQLKEENKR